MLKRLKVVTAVLLALGAAVGLAYKLALLVMLFI